jgi:outer membrane protein insertion porin family
MKKTFPILIVLLTMFVAAKGQKGDSIAINYLSPRQYTVAKITISGDLYLDKNVLISIAGISPNQKISVPGDELTKAISNLWKQQLFSNVQIFADSVKDDRIYLRYNIKTRPKIGTVEFKGNITNNERKKLAEEVKLTPRDIITEQLISTAKQQIKVYFIGKGYPAATIKVTESKPKDTILLKKTGDVENLTFEINKGKRVKINRIIISGNNSFTEQRLHRVMKKTKEKQTLNVFRNSKFEPEEYETDKGNLMNFYHASGYKDARILSDTTYIIKENLMNIEIRLFEGYKYHFRKVTWSGNTKYSSLELNKILNIKKGDVYNPELLEKGLYINQGGLDITSLYMDDGYLFFSVTPVETAVDHDSVDMEIRIFEGPQATINKVTVEGNTKTHDHVILRELRTKPGQKFSRSDIIRSERELAALGYFDPEKMNVTPTPNPKDGTVDLKYTVVEKPSDQIELSGGYGANTLVGVLGLSLNNFSVDNIFKHNWQGYPSGDGQRVSIRAQANGPDLQSYNLSFSDPWFGGKKPNSFTVSAFYSVQNYVGGQQLQSPGVSVGLGKRLKWPDDYFTLYHAVSYQYYNFKNYPLTNGFNTGYANNFNIKHILSRNSADHPIYPTMGSIITFQLQWTPPYSLISGLYSHTNYSDMTNQEKFKLLEYHKWKFSAQHYLSLDRGHKLVLQGLAEFGLIGLYNPEIGLTPFERFYVGGDGLTGFYLDGREIIRLRGYANSDAVTPNIKDLNGNIVNQGGTIYNKYTLELRYPFTKSEAATIYGLAFLEGGNAWLSFKDFNPFTIKRSAGAGIRVFLPMFGLLGFDWGYGFDNDLTTGKVSGGHFHFYIGQPLF